MVFDLTYRFVKGSAVKPVVNSGRVMNVLFSSLLRHSNKKTVVD